MSLKREILKKVTSVPPLPAVVVKLKEKCHDPDVNFRQLAEVIEVEPGLTANLLRLANSAYFGYQGEVSSVQQAIARLGLKRVFQMTLTVCVAPLAQQAVKGYDLSPTALWTHCLATALAAEGLSKELGVADPGDAYTAGMLHDLGKIVLGNFVDVDMAGILALTGTGTTFDAAEREVLGTDHAAVGGALLSQWKLPLPIVDAVKWHHRPNSSESDQALTDIVHMADVLSLNVGWGMGLDGLRYMVEPESARRLALRPGVGECVMASIQPELEELMQLFQQLKEGNSDVVEHSTR